MKRKTTVLFVCTLLLAMCIAGTARAATVTVHVFCCAYSINVSGQPVVQPTINAGDTIHWVWDEVSPSHSVTSVGGSPEVFNTGLQSGGFTFDHTFNTAGTYTYYCTLHGIDNGNGTASGMFGTVTVLAPVKVSALAISPSSVPGTKPAVGTVTLNAAAPAGGLVVTLASNNAAATVPASVTVPEAATTAKFTIKTKAVTATTKVSITGTGGGVSITKVLSVTRPAPKIAALSPDAVVGGDMTICTVVLDTPAPSGGLTVALTSSNALATVPASISIPANSVVGTFTVTTSATASATTAIIKATANGVTKSITLTIDP